MDLESVLAGDDPCSEQARQLYAAFLSRVAAASGNIAVNAPFGPEWEPRWRTDNKAELTPDNSYLVGEARIGESTTAPYTVGILDQGHKALPGNDQGVAMLLSLLQRLQGDVLPNDLRIIACDGSPERFAPFHNRGKGYFEQRSSIGDVLTDLEAQIRRIQSEVLKGHYESLRDMATHDPTMAAAGHRIEPWRVAAIVGDGTPLRPADAAKLAWVARYGPACGVSLITCGVELPPDLPNFEILGAEVPVVACSPPSRGDIATVSHDVARFINRPPMSPNLDSLAPKHLWEETTTDGIRLPIGIGLDGRVHEINLGDDIVHGIIGGRTGSGKTAFLLAMALLAGMRYGPGELRQIYCDLKFPGADGALLAGKDALPHLDGVYANVVDPEAVVALLEQLADERTKRMQTFRDAGVSNIQAYKRAGHEIPRILVYLDEIQNALKSAVGGRILELLEEHGTQSRAAGIHLVLGSQKLPSINDIAASKANYATMLQQFGLRIALSGSTGVMAPDNDDAAEKAPKHEMTVNTAAGTRGNNTQVKSTYADLPIAMEAKARIRRMTAEGSPASPPEYDGLKKPRLARDGTFVGLRPRGIKPPRAVIGLTPALSTETVVMDMRNAPGRNLLVFGRNAGTVFDVVESSVMSLVKQHNVKQETLSGGTEVANPARYVVINCSPGDEVLEDRAEKLNGALSASNPDRVFTYPADEAGTAIGEVAAIISQRQGEAKAPKEKIYVCLVGADGTSKELLGGAKLAAVLKDGPSVGVHVIATANSPTTFRPLLADRYGSAPSLTSLTDAWAITTDLPDTEIAPLIPGSGPTPKITGGNDRVYFYDKAQGGADAKPQKLRTFEVTDDDRRGQGAA